MSTELMSPFALAGVLSPEWVSVEERLPEPEVWVWVFRNDNTWPADRTWNDVFGRKQTQILPAKLMSADNDWYFCYVGGGPVRSHYKNVTHWMPQPEGPNVFFEEE